MKSTENILELLLYDDNHKNLIHNALIRNLEEDYFFGPHCHKNIELCLMQEGECDIIINGERITVHPQEYIILFSNIVHSFSVPHGQKCQFLQLHFSPEIFLNLTSKIYEEQRFLYYISTENMQYLHHRFTEEFLSCIERITREISSKKENHIALANLYIYELILLLSRDIQSSFAQYTNFCHPAVLKAIRYINEHLEDKLTLDMIANECNIGKRYLMKIFQDSMYVTVNDYINLTRINRAMDEISRGENNLTTLALRLGFSNVQYFTTVFKKYSGVTPGKYRSMSSLPC